MNTVIIDCYTDEPSGLGVPPYLGVYPRYVFGALSTAGHACHYLRIDDLRATFKPRHASPKTNIAVLNTTKNFKDTERLLKAAKLIIVIAGIHTPGKYLSAIPGSLKELSTLLMPFKQPKLLVGPAVMGSSQQGGRVVKSNHLDFIPVHNWKGVLEFLSEQPITGIWAYPELSKIAVKGAKILSQLRLPLIAELETGRGCPRTPGCSFCTEPLKNRLAWRDPSQIIEEAKALKSHGCLHFRLGKQTDFYSYKSVNQIHRLLSGLASLKPKTLHIDNVNPAKVPNPEGRLITELIVKHCTSGNVAAMGVESFDPIVCKENNINSDPDTTLKAIRLINKLGAIRGENGMQKFLPGINLILGLKAESKQTLKINLNALHHILNSGLLLRRINIRQVEVFPGTAMAEVGMKYLRKNKSHYFRFRKAVREQIDHNMLKKLAPAGTILKEVFMEVHDGNNSFGRQFGSYPLIVGVKQKLELRQFYNLRIKSHMLRSLVGESIEIIKPIQNSFEP